jgi:hypothetical protein
MTACPVAGCTKVATHQHVRGDTLVIVGDVGDATLDRLTARRPRWWEVPVFSWVDLAWFATVAFISIVIRAVVFG